MAQRVDWVGDHSMYALLVDSAARQEDTDGLQKYAPLAEETAFRYDHKLYKGMAHRAWGVLNRLTGQYEAAEKRLNLALEIFQELGTRWQTGLVLSELGRLATEKADVNQAHTYFAQALLLFAEMGAQPDMARIQANIARLK